MKMLMCSRGMLITMPAFVSTSVHSFDISRGAAKASIFRGDAFRSAVALDLGGFLIARQEDCDSRERGRAVPVVPLLPFNSKQPL